MLLPRAPPQPSAGRLNSVCSGGPPISVRLARGLQAGATRCSEPCGKHVGMEIGHSGAYRQPLPITVWPRTIPLAPLTLAFICWWKANATAHVHVVSPSTWTFSCRLLRVTLSHRPGSDDRAGAHGAGQTRVVGGPGELSPGPSFQGLRPSHNNLLPPVSPETTPPTMPPAPSCPGTKSRNGRMFQKVAGCELSVSHTQPALGIQP